ncbi:MAG: hypothetical protein JETT_0121 [Candidatus Jettenia ecosi]|uniref:Uncharacterized protein n=1 Tax=Candidatus Jettenia ecosi TaxID=2494326 RepID=A0A533QBZ9_9BACT|nr:MAG: hypothetical protein JETT_3667 [Candidatus Jettenia ecosi]TLD40464.1 MAG: hypothetical protein JETT_3276 [Candidatus Jettenia ecosi]TLD40687.1 MAG: hypothetical protein JETT_3055 [Candidatus Jettenia ecosi]TLD41959.1 MAG: hypothetical protein JETT_1748 [Candidatus Jettenia ecosi]TLD43298.1 MAG: hypothetical protein JETT_0467 [Candidatus Jettenia ecosi]
MTGIHGFSMPPLRGSNPFFCSFAIIIPSLRDYETKTP